MANQKLYLVEEAAFKEAYDVPENSPLWRWFEEEGPIIRAYGTPSHGGSIITFTYKNLSIVVDGYVVQEIDE